MEDKVWKERLWSESDGLFFSKGINDPNLLLKFTTLEATYWIQGKFRTCKSKKAESH